MVKPQSRFRRGPLRVMFVHTFMPVGGAETLLVNLVERLDRRRFAPEVCCLKRPGPLGEVLADKVPVYSRLLAGKYDIRVLPRLTRLLRRRKIDVVVTVGAGDRMFWGRLAARLAGVPVIITSLHSTGWPDTIGLLNRMLTPITDGFIGVAEEHGRFLEEEEGFPEDKVFVVPNGVDIERFQPRPADPVIREEMGLPAQGPVVGIVAALRPEKNHELFLRAAARVRAQVPEARFLIVGDGPQRERLEALRDELSLGEAVCFTGTRDDIPQMMALMDVVVLTSRTEASPVTVLEAMAMGKPCVAPNVGSISEILLDDVTGMLVPPEDLDALTTQLLRLLSDSSTCHSLGVAARHRAVEEFAVERMVRGYEGLFEKLYDRKSADVPAVGPRRRQELIETQSIFDDEDLRGDLSAIDVPTTDFPTEADDEAALSGSK